MHSSVKLWLSVKEWVWSFTFCQFALQASKSRPCLEKPTLAPILTFPSWYSRPVPTCDHIYPNRNFLDQEIDLGLLFQFMRLIHPVGPLFYKQHSAELPKPLFLKRLHWPDDLGATYHGRLLKRTFPSNPGRHSAYTQPTLLSPTLGSHFYTFLKTSWCSFLFTVLLLHNWHIPKLTQHALTVLCPLSSLCYSWFISMDS